VHPITLLPHLSDGRFHSGQALGEILGVTRATVWKLIKELEGLGLEIHSVTGKGYRLIDPPELLNPDLIRSMLTPEVERTLIRLDVLPQTESTNQYLLKAPEIEAPGVSLVMAESQSAGRGRRGKPWISPFGRNLYMSFCYSSFTPQHAVEGLSLVIAVALCRSFRHFGAENVGIKWPNDILWQDTKTGQAKKLAGILVELVGEANGQYRVVLGIGVNLHMSTEDADGIDQPWVDLKSILPGAQPSRNQIAAYLINQVHDVLAQFQNQGFAALEQEWKQYDQVLGRQLTVRQGNQTIHGKAVGLDPAGALLVETAEGIKRFYSGEVSIRSTLTQTPSLSR